MRKIVTRKTARRKTARRKIVTRKTSRRKTFRKNRTTRSRTARSRKMSGGYIVHDKEVEFTKEEEDEIKKYESENSTQIINGYPYKIVVSSTKIRDDLFPDMEPELKNNAAYKIQLILKRGRLAA